MSNNNATPAEAETVVRQLLHLYEQTGDADRALSDLRERLGDEYEETLAGLEALRTGKDDPSQIGEGFEQERWAAETAREQGGQALAAFLRMRATLYALGGRMREQWAGLAGFSVYAFFILGYAALTAVIYFSFSAPAMRSMFGEFSGMAGPETAWLMSVGPPVLALTLLLMGVAMLGFAIAVFVARSRGRRLERMRPMMERLPLFGRVVHAYHDLLDTHAASALAAGGLSPSDAIRHAVARGSDRRQGAWQAAMDNGKGEDSKAPAGFFAELAVAHRAGTLEQELVHQSEDALARFEQALDRARQLFAPIFYLILGLTVGLLVIGIYLPIFKLGAVV